MAKRLTELLAEALAKSQTDEGRRALLEERDRLDAEAVQAAAQREQHPPEAPEAGKAAQTPPEGVQEPTEVRPNRRIDPIFPVVQSVREAPEREAGRLAFGGIIEDRKSLPAQLPLLPTPEGPRVPILERRAVNRVPPPVTDSPRPGPDRPESLALCRGRSDEQPQPRPRLPPPEPPGLVEGDSGRSGGGVPPKPPNPAPSSETEAVGSPQIDEDAAPRGTGTPGFVACGCHAVFDGPPGSTACPSCAAAPEGAAVKAWTHAPGPDGGTTLAL